LNIREVGKILGYLISAHQASREAFVKRRIEDAVGEISKTIEPKEGLYRDLVEGIIDARVPLKLIANVSRLLPGEPLLAEVAGRAEGFFVKEEEGVKTIVGLNETGKTLVNAMISAVRERAKESTKKPENPKNLKK
jgi:hypothetical protein